MEPTIVAHNIEPTPRLRDYVEKKTARLDRYMPNLTAIDVVLSAENTRDAQQRNVVEVTIRDDRGTILRAEVRNSDMFAAVDSVVDKLYRQIERYRGKQRDRYRGKGQDAIPMGDMLPIPDDTTEDEQTIVRRKSFPMYPMSADEALDQMELLGHDFFVFFNSDEEAVNVVYRRHDGNFGLLLPEMD